MSAGFTPTVFGEVVDALVAVLADCDRRNTTYGEASVRLSTDVRIKANKALSKARGIASEVSSVGGLK